MRNAALAAVALGLVACDAVPPPLYGDTPAITTPDDGNDVACTTASTVGVPIEARPTYAERLALYGADRARAEPGKTGWPDFPAVPPLHWHHELALAALAHSVDMRDTPCFQHDSCDGTPVFDRIKSFLKSSTLGGMGENIAAGVSDPFQVIEQSWINEVGAPPGETGHRENMFNKSFNYVGFGYADGGQRFHGYWTQDLGSGSLPTPVPPIPVGSHYPSEGPVVTFGAVYFEEGGTAPQSVDVLIDGKATPLTLVRGQQAAGAFEGKVMLDSGCHRYRFRAVVGKEAFCFPGKGTLGVRASGASDCPDYAP